MPPVLAIPDEGRVATGAGGSNVSIESSVRLDSNLYLSYIYRRSALEVPDVELPLDVNPQSPDPLYRQIADQIRSLILVGHLRPGQPLPSIRHLAEDLAVSVITSKRAYEELERDGLIVMRPALGCFVSDLADAAREQARRAKVRDLLVHTVQEGRSLGFNDADLLSMMTEILQHEVVGGEQPRPG